jgi:hypothetical protein
MRLREHSFTITEHEPDKPWLVRGSSHGTVTLGGWRELH